MISLRLKTRLVKEFVAVSGMVEIILGAYVGVKFALGESWQAWLWLLLLGGLTYLSTRLWIWYFDKRVKNE